MIFLLDVYSQHHVTDSDSVQPCRNFNDYCFELFHLPSSLLHSERCIWALAIPVTKVQPRIDTCSYVPNACLAQHLIAGFETALHIRIND